MAAPGDKTVSVVGGQRTLSAPGRSLLFPPRGATSLLDGLPRVTLSPLLSLRFVGGWLWIARGKAPDCEDKSARARVGRYELSLAIRLLLLGD
jgi:hypothetical protein